MLRKSSLFLVVLALCGVLLALLVKVLTSSAEKPIPSARPVVTAEEICRKDRKVPLTAYQKGMCAYLAQEFWDDPVMIEIAFCESSWRHQKSDGSVRVNYNKDEFQSIDVGLFGVNIYWNREILARLGLNPYNIRENVKAAKYLRKTRGYQDWKSSQWCWGWVLQQQQA